MTAAMVTVTAAIMIHDHNPHGHSDSYRTFRCDDHSRGFIPYNANYAAACEDWRDRFPDVSPPPWDEPIDEWVLNI